VWVDGEEERGGGVFKILFIFNDQIQGEVGRIELVNNMSSQPLWCPPLPIKWSYIDEAPGEEEKGEGPMNEKCQNVQTKEAH